jgi:hypothetical protein
MTFWILPALPVGHLKPTTILAAVTHHTVPTLPGLIVHNFPLAHITPHFPILPVSICSLNLSSTSDIVPSLFRLFAFVIFVDSLLTVLFVFASIAPLWLGSLFHFYN